MSALFFEDNRGNLRLVNPIVPADNIYLEIVNFIEKLNPNFHVHYIRSWAIDGGMKYDVGSHTEFFITKDKCCANCDHYLGGGDFATCCREDPGLWYDDNYCDKWKGKERETQKEADSN